ncbi:hypothetical protein [Streptomyces echinatus]|uniref:hypothetical protein n=1 Tax=Streptomyces echinatus TaxID=67293 RepID=UPI0037A6FD56
MEALVHVLIPDDPVLASSFLLLEEPLLYSLRYYYWTELTSRQQQTVGEAYESWGELQQVLPARFNPPVPDSEPVGGDDYVLEGIAGNRLTRLYAIDAGAHIGPLDACYLMLRRAQLDGWRDDLADVLREINKEVDCVDRLRRVLRVLRLVSPPHLLQAIRRVAPHGPVTALALNAGQEREHKGHCAKVIAILSADDSFAYDNHRELYML